MSAHTPTPWKARDYLCDNGDVWIDCNVFRNRGKGSLVAGTVARALAAGTGSTATAAENAEFIVRAVNAHDALVLAAREAAVVIADVLAASGQSRMSSPVLVHLLNALDVADGKQREPLVPLTSGAPK